MIIDYVYSKLGVHFPGNTLPNDTVRYRVYHCKCIENKKQNPIGVEQLHRQQKSFRSKYRYTVSVHKRCYFLSK